MKPENTQIKQGDVVVLKTGGPQMVVLSSIANEQICTCGWFFRTHLGDYTKYRREQFPPRVLRVVNA